jgi:hypothetical protein
MSIMLIDLPYWLVILKDFEHRGQFQVAIQAELRKHS